ncbi:hypothetical protein LO762_10185 [Actinocorallia sp. API 0066]|uniref:hypothetical protein n=1 Tax=Actinocorallia sp. API 0066 TaxID=2896846 RepID=UPI001E3A8E2F|nr:hypothetical protein [Actinocorallia sp. API 0066]MCD0449557.1 hypothetical protein [Actinocorallia sp. API 0066]
MRAAAVLTTALILVGAVLAVPAAAAPASRCAAGTWRLAKADLTVRQSAKTKLRITGGAGAVLVLGGGKATHRYAGSAKLKESGTSGGAQVAGWLRYRGTLRLKAKVTGTRLTATVSSATGNATLKLRQTRPLQLDPAPRGLAALLKSGEFSGVPYNAQVTCSRTALKLRQTGTSGGAAFTGAWSYRRV